MTLAKLSTFSVAALAALTATGNGAAVDVGEMHGKARAILSFTQPGGTTPTWDFRLEHSADGSTGWETLASFAQLTGATVAGLQSIEVDMDRARRFVRLARTGGGTSPTVTAGLALVGTKQVMP
jgi:hypothetical protein